VAQSFGVEAVRLQSAESLQVDIAAEQPAVQMEPIAIEDLLGREEHGVKKGDELTVLSAKTVLVTGGGGSIGAELCRQLAELGLARLVVVDSCEFNLYKIENDLRAAGEVEVEPVIADVRDKGRMAAVFRAQRPDYVFHAAALKHVPLVEHNPGEAVLTNVLGSRNIIDLAVEHGCKAAVLVSTDKAVNPTSFMGATKRAAEIYMQAKSDALSARRSNIAIVDGKVVGTKQTDTRLMAVRFGNVLGSSGSVVPLFEQQLQAGGPLTVTHPMVERFFMTVPEAVSLILNGFTTLIWRRNLRYTTFFLDMGEPIVYSGLRPGEKLYEELSYKDEEIIDVDVEGLYALSPTRDGPAAPPRPPAPSRPSSTPPSDPTTPGCSRPCGASSRNTNDKSS
jgi:O-antigen biosynthesis protein WbqV